MRGLVWIWVLLQVVAASAASAALLFVAKNGNDANPGTSSQPFLTIQKAFDEVDPGDEIVIRDGTYFETPAMSAKSTSAGSGIVIRAETPGTVMISGMLETPATGGSTWTSEGNNIFSLSMANQPTFVVHDGVFLHGFLKADLEDGDALTTSVGTINITSYGFAHDAGRVFVRLKDNSNPTGQNVLISDTRSFGNWTVGFSSVPFVTIEDIHVQGGAWACIRGDSSSTHMTLRRVIMTYCHIGARISSNTTIENSDYSHPGFNTFSEDLRALNNNDYMTFHLSKNYASGAFTLEGGIVGPFTSGNTITNYLSRFNFIHEAFDGEKLGLFNNSEAHNNRYENHYDNAVEMESFGGENSIDVKLHHNVFVDNFNSPISHQENSLQGPQEVFRNVIIHDTDNLENDGYPANRVVKVDSPNATGGIKYYHNTIIGDTRAIIDSGNGGDHFEFKNNLFIMTDSDSPNTQPDYASNLLINASNISTLTASGGQFIGSNVSLMNFVNASNRDFRLQSNSPAVDAGISLPGFNDGEPGGPDIGAYRLGDASDVIGLPAMTSEVIVFVDKDDPDRSGSSNCGSTDAPCESIKDGLASNNLVPGAKLQIRSASTIYNEGEIDINKSGTSGNPITIESAPGHVPIICNPDFNDNDVFHITNRSHLIIRNLRFDCTGLDAPRSVIRMTSTSSSPTNIIIEDNEFINIGGRLALNGTTAAKRRIPGDKRIIWVDTPNNTSSNSQSCEICYNNVTIRRNLFDGFQAAAIRLINAHNGLVEDNEIKNGVCAMSTESCPRKILEPIKIGGRDHTGVIVRRNFVHSLDEDECPLIGNDAINKGAGSSNQLLCSTPHNGTGSSCHCFPNCTINQCGAAFTAPIYCDTGAKEFIFEYNAVIGGDQNGNLEDPDDNDNSKGIFVESDCQDATVRFNAIKEANQCYSWGSTSTGSADDGFFHHNSATRCSLGFQMRNAPGLTFADNILQIGSDVLPSCPTDECVNAEMSGRVTDDNRNDPGAPKQPLTLVDRNFYNRLDGSGDTNHFQYNSRRTFNSYRGGSGCTQNVANCEANSQGTAAIAFANIALNDFSLQKGSAGIGTDTRGLNAGAKQRLRLEQGPTEIGLVSDTTLVLDFDVFTGFNAINAGSLHRATFNDTHLPLFQCNMNLISVTYDGVNAPILAASIQNAVGCGNTPGPDSDKCHLTMQSPPPSSATDVRVSLQARAVFDCAPLGGLAVQTLTDFKTSNEVETNFQVTNNTQGTPNSVRLLSAVVQNATPSQVELGFSAPTPPVLPATGCTGFACTQNGVAWPIVSCVRTADLQQTLTMASALTVGAVAACAYTPGNVQDEGGNPLEASNISVVNNVLSVGGPLLNSATVLDTSKNFLEKTGLPGIHDEGELIDGDTGGAESLIALPVVFPSVSPVTAFVTWDLGEVKTLDRIEVFGDNSGLRQCVTMDLSVSTDNVCYAPVLTGADCNQAATVAHGLSAAQGRFLKLEITGLSTGVQLPEAQVFGQGSGTVSDQVGLKVEGNVHLTGPVRIQ